MHRCVRVSARVLIVLNLSSGVRVRVRASVSFFSKLGITNKLSLSQCSVRRFCLQITRLLYACTQMTWQITVYPVAGQTGANNNPPGHRVDH